VSIHRTYRGSCCSDNSYPIYEDLRRQTSVFAGVEAHYPLLSVTLNDAAGPARIWGQVVTPEYFGVLGTRLLAGRPLSAAEPTSVVISHSLWQRRFGGDPAALGARISLDNGAFTVAGVAPPEFRGPDFWVPLASLDLVMPEHPSLQDRSAPWLIINARLRPGISLTHARGQLTSLAGRLVPVILAPTRILSPLRRLRRRS
jgi:hypothetical protein